MAVLVFAGEIWTSPMRLFIKGEMNIEVDGELSTSRLRMIVFH